MFDATSCWGAELPSAVSLAGGEVARVLWADSLAGEQLPRLELEESVGSWPVGELRVDLVD